MSLRIIEIHPAEGPKKPNTEWFVVVNEGEQPFSTKNCSLTVGKGKTRSKHRSLGTIDPGFVVGPGEKVRIVSGNPGKKSHGAMPDESERNYSLFLGGACMNRKKTIVTLTLRTRVIASATFDPGAEGCVRATS